MKAQLISKILCVLFLLTLSACTLPEVTPVTSDTQEPTSSFNTTAEVTTPSEVSPQNAAVINNGNAAALTVTGKVAITSPQVLGWAEDSQSLAVVNQTADANGNQLFGATTLSVPSLAPQYVYSAQGQRISAIAPDGHTAAVISQDMLSYILVDLAASNTILLTNTPGFRIGNLSFSPDQKYLAVTQAEMWEVVLYALPDGTEVRRLTGFETAAPVFDAGFSASPQWIIWHARATAMLQEVETGKLSPAFSHEDFLSTFTLSPDGTILATAAGKTVNSTFTPAVTLWDVTSGLEMHTLVLATPANSLSFSPDGKLLAVATGMDLQLWNVADGALLATFTEHLDYIALVMFSPDGKSIATAGYDNQLYLWQVLE